MKFIGVIACILIGIIGAFVIIRFKKNIDTKRAKEEEARLRLRKEERKRNTAIALERVRKENLAIAELKAKYGALTTSINLEPGVSKNLTSTGILFFEESQTIIVRTKILSFTDILGYSVIDSGTTIYIEEPRLHTSKTTTSTSDMIGRAIIGGVLTGGVGAVIGAATANKNTITESAPVKTTVKNNHDYLIQLNINSLEEPFVKIHIGESESKMQEIASLMDIIIHRSVR